MSKQYTVEDYAQGGKRAANNVILAGTYGILASPLLYWGVSNAKDAKAHHDVSQLLTKQLEQTVNDSAWPRSFHVVENGGYAIGRGFQSAQAVQDYAKLCNDTSMKEGAISAGCFLAYILPVAFLLGKFFKNLGLKRKWDKARLEEMLRTASMNTGEE